MRRYCKYVPVFVTILYNVHLRHLVHMTVHAYWIHLPPYTEFIDIPYLYVARVTCTEAGVYGPHTMGSIMVYLGTKSIFLLESRFICYVRRMPCLSKLFFREFSRFLLKLYFLIDIFKLEIYFFYINRLNRLNGRMCSNFRLSRIHSVRTHIIFGKRMSWPLL